MKTLKYNLAFTLAEVLITLGIIGVVAEMTIPTLVKDTKDQEIASAVKKAYSDLSQATLMLQAQGIDIDTTDNASLRESYKNVFTYLEEGTIAEIWNPPYRYYKSSGSTNMSTWTNLAASLKNGMFVSFYIEDTNCNMTKYLHPPLIGHVCAQLQMDINGDKGPNMFGKDLVTFFLVKTDGTYRIIPSGALGDQRYCKNPADDGNIWTSGDGCTNYYITGQELP